MQSLADTLVAIKQSSHKEEEAEKKFLQQIDAELIAVAGRTQARSRDESVSIEGDTIQDSLSEDSIMPESTSNLVNSIVKARELIKMLLERNTRPPMTIPPLTNLNPPQFENVDISKSLTESYRDSSIYNKILINDDILNSLSMSEREAVVYSLINAGAGVEDKHDVRLEDLLNVSNAEEKFILSSARLEDLSSIIEEESGVDSAKDPIGLTFTLPEIKEHEAESPRTFNKPAHLNLSPISTPNSGRSVLKRSQSFGYSDVPTPLSESNDLNRAQFQDELESKTSKNLEGTAEFERLKRDYSDLLEDD